MGQQQLIPGAQGIPGSDPLKDLMKMPVMQELGQIGQAAKGQMPGATGGVGQAPSGQPWQTPQGIDTGYVGPTDAGSRLAILRAYGVV